MEKKKVKVLQVAYNLSMGGVPKDIIYPARLLKKEDVEFDVLVTTEEIGYFEDEFKQYGNIYRISIKPGKNKLSRAIHVFIDPFIVYFRAKTFLKKQGHYDAIHCRHIGFNAPFVAAAYKVGVPIRIAHSHVNAPNIQKPHQAIYNYISQKIVRKYATMCLGVTEGALKYMIGNGRGYVIKNPTVDLSKFTPEKYQYQEHEDIRLIMVGSIQPRKNQMFGVKVLHEIMKMGQKARMTIIGYPTDPESGYLESIQEYIKENRLDSNVTFLPKDSDVPKALSESDIMLLPSTREGLPNTALEAQAMGVYCFVSTDVEKICDCGLCSFCELNAGSKKWAEAVIEYKEKTNLRKSFIDMSSWDNREVSKLHLKIWRGENPFDDNTL